MMQSSHSPAVSMTSTRNLSASTTPAASATGELFGPVLQQQTDAQEQATTTTSASQRQGDKAGAKTTSKPAAPAAQAHNAGANGGADTAADSSVNAAMKSSASEVQAPAYAPVTSADNGDSTENSHNDLMPLPVPTQTDFSVQEQQLEQGKNLPAGGNSLPVSEPVNGQRPDAAAMPKNLIFTANTGDKAATSAHAYDSVDADRSTRTALRGTISAEFTPVAAADSAAAKDSDTDRGYTAQFTAPLQKPDAPGRGPELFAALDVLAASNTTDEAPDAGISNAGTTALASPDKNLLARLLPTALNTSTSFQIEAQPGSPDWNNQVGDKIRWLSRADINFAEMKLNPAELGTIQIKVVTEDQQTRVSFITSNAATRDIIEATLPRLRELLQSSGMQLEQSDISHSNDSSKQAQRHDSVSKDAFFNETEASTGQLVVKPRSSLGQIDHYV